MAAALGAALSLRIFEKSLPVAFSIASAALSGPGHSRHGRDLAPKESAYCPWPCPKRPFRLISTFR